MPDISDYMRAMADVVVAARGWRDAHEDQFCCGCWAEDQLVIALDELTQLDQGRLDAMLVSAIESTGETGA